MGSEFMGQRGGWVSSSSSSCGSHSGIQATSSMPLPMLQLLCVCTLTRGQRSFPNDVVMSPVRGFHACAIALSLPLFFFQYRSISLSLCLSIYLSALLSPLSQHGDIGATIQQWSQRGGFMQLSHWLYIRASEQFVNL